MKEIRLFHAVLPAAILVFTLSCQKENGTLQQQHFQQMMQQQGENTVDNAGVAGPSFNLNVRLYGEGDQSDYHGDGDGEQSDYHGHGDQWDNHGHGDKSDYYDDGGKPGHHGNKEESGFIKFRQDPDTARIITLDIWVRGLEPNHEYLLQRAVDAANVVDGNCTSTTWLTLGKGLTPQSILTDDDGSDKENLWRAVTAIPRGTAFDIHFRVVDATTLAVILNSDCYAYVVR
jgi:hypothetical protein